MSDDSLFKTVFGGLAALFRKKGETEMDRRTYEALETDQREMIQGVVELSTTTVKEVMVPRIDTVFLSAEASRDELLACISESEHSRFPVYEGTIDKVIGVLYVKDVLKNLVRGEPFDIQKLVRKPFLSPSPSISAISSGSSGGGTSTSPWRWTNTAGFRGSSAWRTSSRRSWGTFRTNLTTKRRISSA
jgi:CBS domain containing-hemolysin-like protein